MPDMKLVNARTDTLFVDRFEACENQSWCIIGTNRSGLGDFFRIISGEDTGIRADCLELPEKIGALSFRHQQEIYETELKNDDTDFMDRIDPGTPARQFLHDIDAHAGLIDAFAMTHCLDKGYRQLSSGQARKLLLLSRMTRGDSCLVVHAPYEGLDTGSVKELDRALFYLYQRHVQLVLFVHNLGDMPPWCTHAGVVSEGRLVLQGPVEEVGEQLKGYFEKERPGFRASAQDLLAGKSGKEASPPRGTFLVRLKNGSAGYGGRDIFRGLTLDVRNGDHTLVSGPNGSGKSTLLQVITGDHPACYQNDLTLFGIKRGSGESIWELKARLGMVSSELHRNYIVPGTTLHCVISGLFDSIGLYRPYALQQEKQALAWLERIGMPDKADVPFRDLEFSDQRLVLIARSLIKAPELLILDEPTQGLDELNRMAVLDFLGEVAKENISTILYVSHRQDEYRPFFAQHIRMEPHMPDG